MMMMARGSQPGWWHYAPCAQVHFLPMLKAACFLLSDLPPAYPLASRALHHSASLGGDTRWQIPKGTLAGPRVPRILHPGPTCRAQAASRASSPPAGIPLFSAGKQRSSSGCFCPWRRARASLLRSTGPTTTSHPEMGAGPPLPSASSPQLPPVPPQPPSPLCRGAADCWVCGTGSIPPLSPGSPPAAPPSFLQEANSS